MQNLEDKSPFRDEFDFLGSEYLVDSKDGPSGRGCAMGRDYVPDMSPF
jgi:hypothetical protein